MCGFFWAMAGIGTARAASANAAAMRRLCSFNITGWGYWGFWLESRADESLHRFRHGSVSLSPAVLRNQFIRYPPLIKGIDKSLRNIRIGDDQRNRFQPSIRR